MPKLPGWLRKPFLGKPPRTPKVAISWQLHEGFGWGLVGVHTALYLAEHGRPPLLATEPDWQALRAGNRERLASLEGVATQVNELLGLHAPNPVVLEEFVVLHALFARFIAFPMSQRLRGGRNVGLLALEDTLLDEPSVQRARTYDRVVVHSTYNREVLAAHGIDAGLALQGVDPTEMAPQPRRGRFAGRFVVFSGGKLEHRKGHDIVVAAFTRFHRRHPEALLATAWENLWPKSAGGLAASTLAPVAPTLDEHGQLRLRDWALANGVPAHAFLDLGHLDRDQIAPTLAECDAAVFPNRCEGATNLVAMEAMACGVPSVVSANTGHLDIVDDGRCIVLRDQRPVPDPTGSMVGWGESSVDELVEALESLYTDRAAARARAAKAVEFFRTQRTWRQFAQQLVAQLPA
jgi:glycosyltransferase involved in cell wall biosynthesis